MVASAVRACTFGLASQLTQSPVFFDLKCRFPSIYLNSGMLAVRWLPLLALLLDDLPEELESPDDEESDSLSLLLTLEDEEESDPEPHRRDFPGFADLLAFLARLFSFFRLCLSFCFSFFLWSLTFAFKASLPDLSQSSRILHTSCMTSSTSVVASVSSASMRRSRNLHNFCVQRGAPGRFLIHLAFRKLGSRYDGSCTLSSPPPSLAPPRSVAGAPSTAPSSAILHPLSTAGVFLGVVRAPDAGFVYFSSLFTGSLETTSHTAKLTAAASWLRLKDMTSAPQAMVNP